MQHVEAGCGDGEVAGGLYQVPHKTDPTHKPLSLKNEYLHIFCVQGQEGEPSGPGYVHLPQHRGQICLDAGVGRLNPALLEYLHLFDDLEIRNVCN